MSGRHRLPVVLVAAVLAAVSNSLVAAQAPVAKLSITGDVKTPLALTPAEVKAMPRTTVTIKDAGRDVTYEGVLMSEILKKAGVTLGAGGNTLATCVLASASDGYDAVFSIGEIDPALTANQVIVADTMDGKPLAANLGTFKIVAPRDLRGARGVRMLDSLKVVTLRR